MPVYRFSVFQHDGPYAKMYEHEDTFTETDLLKIVAKFAPDIALEYGLDAVKRKSSVLRLDVCDVIGDAKFDHYMDSLGFKPFQPLVTIGFTDQAVRMRSDYYTRDTIDAPEGYQGSEPKDATDLILKILYTALRCVIG